MKVNFIKCAVPSIIGSLAVLLGSGSCAISKNCAIDPENQIGRSSYNTAPINKNASFEGGFNLGLNLKNTLDFKSLKSETQDRARNSEIFTNIKNTGRVENSFLSFDLIALVFISLLVCCYLGAKSNNNLFSVVEKNRILNRAMSQELSKKISRYNNFLTLMENIIYSKIKSLYQNAQGIGNAGSLRACFIQLS